MSWKSETDDIGDIEDLLDFVEGLPQKYAEHKGQKNENQTQQKVISPTKIKKESKINDLEAGKKKKECCGNCSCMEGLKNNEMSSPKVSSTGIGKGKVCSDTGKSSFLPGLNSFLKLPKFV